VCSDGVPPNATWLPVANASAPIACAPPAARSSWCDWDPGDVVAAERALDAIEVRQRAARTGDAFGCRGVNIGAIAGSGPARLGLDRRQAGGQGVLAGRGRLGVPAGTRRRANSAPRLILSHAAHRFSRGWLT